MSPRRKLNEEIAEKLEEMHSESPDKGYRRLRDDLEVYHNIPVNLSTTNECCVSAVRKESNQPLNTVTMVVPDRQAILNT